MDGNDERLAEFDLCSRDDFTFPLPAPSKVTPVDNNYFVMDLKAEINNAAP